MFCYFRALESVQKYFAGVWVKNVWELISTLESFPASNFIEKVRLTTKK